jgi:orotidine-5'-phosphate decarboxylase
MKSTKFSFEKFISATPFGEDSGDQKRVADINFSKENLVDFIVVGRPIYKNENPNDIVKKILQNI